MSDTENFVFDGFDVAPDAAPIQGWDGNSSAPAIPAGEHLFTLTSLTVADTKAGDGKNLVAEFTCQSPGEGNGETVRAWFLCVGPKVKRGHKGRIAQVFRDALQVPGINPTTLQFETKNAVGCQMYATATLKERRYYDPNTGEEKSATNVELSSERPVNPAPVQAQAAAAAPAAPPRAPSAPPSRPPAAPPARAAAPPQRAR